MPIVSEMIGIQGVCPTMCPLYPCVPAGKFDLALGNHLAIDDVPVENHDFS